MLVPPVGVEYQLMIPIFVEASNITVPEPQIDSGVSTIGASGIVFTVATIGVRGAHPAST